MQLPIDPQSRVADRSAIRATIEAYFSAIDRHDWNSYGQCFTEDAVFESHRAEPEMVVGRAALVARAALRRDRPVSNHSLSNLHVIVTSDAATVTTHAIAHLAVQRESGPRVVVRGLLYQDEMSRDESGTWRISKRKHQPLWQFEADAAPLGY